MLSLSKVRRLSLHRLLKSQRTSDPVILVDDFPTLGRNRIYYTFGQLIHNQDEELPDNIKIRLIEARLKALEKHKEVWG